MKRYELQGSITVEMSFLVPMILFLIMSCILAVFYYHDKNILSGAAYEIEVTADASRRYMRVSVMKRASVTEPEKTIRDLRRLKGKKE